jgi:hypothetical protein
VPVSQYCYGSRLNINHILTVNGLCIYSTVVHKVWGQTSKVPARPLEAASEHSEAECGKSEKLTEFRDLQEPGTSSEFQNSTSKCSEMASKLSPSTSFVQDSGAYSDFQSSTLQELQISI